MTADELSIFRRLIKAFDQMRIHNAGTTRGQVEAFVELEEPRRNCVGCPCGHPAEEHFRCGCLTGCPGGCPACSKNG